MERDHMAEDNPEQQVEGPTPDVDLNLENQEATAQMEASAEIGSTLSSESNITPEQITSEQPEEPAREPYKWEGRRGARVENELYPKPASPQFSEEFEAAQAEIREATQGAPHTDNRPFEDAFAWYRYYKNINPSSFIAREQRQNHERALEQSERRVNDLFEQAKEQDILKEVDEQLDQVYDLVRYKFNSDPSFVRTILMAARGEGRLPAGRLRVKTAEELEEDFWFLFGDEGAQWADNRFKGIRGVYYNQGLYRVSQEFAQSRGAIIPSERQALEEWEWNIEDRGRVEPKMWEFNGIRIEFDPALVTNQEQLERAYRQYIRDNIDFLQADHQRLINETVRLLGDAVLLEGRRLGLPDREVKRMVSEAQGRLLILPADHFARINQLEPACAIMERLCRDFTPERIEALNKAYGGKVWLAAILLETEFSDYYKAYEGSRGELINQNIDQDFFKDRRKKALTRRIAVSALRNPRDIEKIMDEDANASELFGDSPQASQLREIYRKLDEADIRLKNRLRAEASRDPDKFTVQDRQEINLRKRMLDIENTLRQLTDQGLSYDAPEVKPQIELLTQVQQQYDQLATQRFVDIEKEANLTPEEKTLLTRYENEAKEAVDIATNLFTGLNWVPDLAGPRVWINDQLINIEDAVYKILKADPNYKYKDSNGNPVVNYNYFLAFDDNARQTLLGPLPIGPDGQPVKRPKILESIRQAIDPTGEIAAIKEAKDGLNANERQRYAVYDKMKAMRDAYFDAFYRLRTGKNLPPSIELRKGNQRLSYAEASVWGSGQPLATKKDLYLPEYLLSQKRDYVWKEEFCDLIPICETRIRSIIRELGFRSYKELSVALGMMLLQNQDKTKIIDSYEVQRYYQDRLPAADNQRKRAFGGQISNEFFIGFLMSAFRDINKHVALVGYSDSDITKQEAAYAELLDTLHRPLEFAKGFFPYENDRTYYVHDSMRDAYWFFDRFVGWFLDENGGKKVYPMENDKLGGVLNYRVKRLGEGRNFSYWEEIKRRELK